MNWRACNPLVVTLISLYSWLVISPWLLWSPSLIYIGCLYLSGHYNDTWYDETRLMCSNINIILSWIGNTSERAYVIVKEENCHTDLVKLLHLHSDSESWDGNLHDLQLLNRMRWFMNSDTFWQQKNVTLSIYTGITQPISHPLQYTTKPTVKLTRLDNQNTHGEDTVLVMPPYLPYLVIGNTV